LAGFTNHLEDLIIGHIFGGSAYTQPGTLYVGLFTAIPNEAGSGTEVSGGGYARQSAAWSRTTGGNAIATTSSSITFPAAQSDWGNVQWLGVFDALSGGNLLCFQSLTKANFVDLNPKQINTGDIFQVDSGNLKVQIE
jgi:hypothetical protein